MPVASSTTGNPAITSSPVLYYNPTKVHDTFMKDRENKQRRNLLNIKNTPHTVRVRMTIFLS